MGVGEISQACVRIEDIDVCTDIESTVIHNCEMIVMEAGSSYLAVELYKFNEAP